MLSKFNFKTQSNYKAAGSSEALREGARRRQENRPDMQLQFRTRITKENGERKEAFVNEFNIKSLTFDKILGETKSANFDLQDGTVYFVTLEGDENGVMYRSHKGGKKKGNKAKSDVFVELLQEAGLVSKEPKENDKYYFDFEEISHQIEGVVQVFKVVPSTKTVEEGAEDDAEIQDMSTVEETIDNSELSDAEGNGDLTDEFAGM